MKKQQNLATEKLIRKFDQQLRDIISTDLRSAKYIRTKAIVQWEPLVS